MGTELVATAIAIFHNLPSKKRLRGKQAVLYPSSGLAP